MTITVCRRMSTETHLASGRVESTAASTSCCVSCSSKAGGRRAHGISAGGLQPNRAAVAGLWLILPSLRCMAARSACRPTPQAGERNTSSSSWPPPHHARSRLAASPPIQRSVQLGPALPPTRCNSCLQVLVPPHCAGGGRRRCDIPAGAGCAVHGQREAAPEQQRRGGEGRGGAQARCVWVDADQLCRAPLWSQGAKIATCVAQQRAREGGKLSCLTACQSSA